MRWTSKHHRPALHCFASCKCLINLKDGVVLVTRQSVRMNQRLTFHPTFLDYPQRLSNGSSFFVCRLCIDAKPGGGGVTK